MISLTCEWLTIPITILSACTSLSPQNISLKYPELFGQVFSEEIKTPKVKNSLHHSANIWMLRFESSPSDSVVCMSLPGLCHYLVVRNVDNRTAVRKSNHHQGNRFNIEHLASWDVLNSEKHKSCCYCLEFWILQCTFIFCIVCTALFFNESV